MKKSVLYFLAALTVILLFFIGAGSVFSDVSAKTSIARPQKLVILFTHDLHSHLKNYLIPSDRDGVIDAGGYARLSSAIKNERKGKENNVLVVDAGDFSMGTLFHAIRSTHSAELVTMGIIGYDAVTFGNHDFDFGPDELSKALLKAKKLCGVGAPPIVAFNTFAPHQKKELASFRKACVEYPVMPYKIINRAGMRIGIFGLIGKNAAGAAPQAKPAIFTDYIDAAREAVNILREKEKVDMVICLSHCGTWKNKKISEDEILAREVPGINVIISGHTHTVLENPIRAGDTYIVSSGAYCRYLGRLEVAKKNNGKFEALDYRLIPITSALPEDKKISALLPPYIEAVNKNYLSKFNSAYARILAQCPFPLARFDWDKGDRSDYNNSASGLCDLVTDSYIYAVEKIEGEKYEEISLAAVPFGMIREPLAQGKLEVNDIFRVLSLGRGLDGVAGYPIVAFYLIGEEIKGLMEIETTLAPAMEDVRLQISGMKFSYDSKAGAFARVKKVEVETADGGLAPLDAKRLYRVCTNLNVLLMCSYLKSASGGKIIILPKDKNGNLVKVGTEHCSVPTIIIADKSNGLELKEWTALAMYLRSFPDINGDGIPDIPARYRAARKTIVQK